jgi:N-formylglutamate deformylase
MELFHFTPGDTRARERAACRHLPEVAAGDQGRSPSPTPTGMSKLYAGVVRHGAKLLVATHSRYVVDLSDPAGKPLYPAPTTQRSCRRSFANHALWAAPARRRAGSRIVATGSLPRRAASVAQLNSASAWSCCGTVTRSRAGAASAADLNLGTAKGPAAARSRGALIADRQLDHHHGARQPPAATSAPLRRPSDNVNALRLEVAQSAYMDEATPQTGTGARRTALIDTPCPRPHRMGPGAGLMEGRACSRKPLIRGRPSARPAGTTGVRPTTPPAAAALRHRGRAPRIGAGTGFALNPPARGNIGGSAGRTAARRRRDDRDRGALRHRAIVRSPPCNCSACDGGRPRPMPSFARQLAVDLAERRQRDHQIVQAMRCRYR